MGKSKESEQTDEKLLEELTPEELTRPMAGSKDDEPGDEDYGPNYYPPKRDFNGIIFEPEECQAAIAKLKGEMLNPELSRTERDVIAQSLAEYVAASGELDERIADIKAGLPYKDEFISKVMRSEYDALFDIQTRKRLTAQRFGKSSGAMAVSSMLNNKTYGEPMVLSEIKEQIELQMADLVDSGTAREQQIAKLVILSSNTAEALMVESAKAKTPEAKAMVLEKATKCMERSAKLVEKLDAMASPRAGRFLEQAPAKQLPNKAKKLKERE